jgi:nicotinic acid phosphoribosyltransferase
MSNSNAPEMREFALRLLAYESASGKPANAKYSVTFRVCEKLRVQLSKTTGVGGFSALLSRALALASEEAPWLRKLQIDSDGSLKGLHELEAKLDSSLVAKGQVVLLTQLLGLLVTFIGPALTLQLLQDVWPTDERTLF